MAAEMADMTAELLDVWMAVLMVVPKATQMVALRADRMVVPMVAQMAGLMAVPKADQMVAH